MKNNLIPTPIVDKNGKQTTVHKKLETGDSRTLGIAPPMLSADSKAPSVESYKKRLDRIQHENQQWSLGDKGTAAERAAVAVKALNVVGNLIMTIASDQKRNEGTISDLGVSIASLSETGNYEPLIIAERFSGVVGVIKDVLDADEWSSDEWEGEGLDEGEPISFDGEDTSDWESENVSTDDVSNIIDLVYTLREMNLMSPYELPERGESRFFAHLYMATTKTINYRRDDPNTLELIRLLDEYPERGKQIGEAIKAKVHAAGIRALITDEVQPSLASGTL